MRWLEFLGHVRLRREEGFDEAAELQRASATATDAAVLSEAAQQARPGQVWGSVRRPVPFASVPFT